MEVTVDSDTLFEAYEAVENEEAKQAIRDAVVAGRKVGADDIAGLYPQTVETVDADEIVAELEDTDQPDDDDIQAVCDWLHEENRDIQPYGGFIDAFNDVEGDIFVNTQNDPDDFETPDGWVAIEEDADGVGFVREDDEPDVPFEEYLRENIFTLGGYAYEERTDRRMAVAERTHGGGYICRSDMEKAVSDENVKALTDKTKGHRLEHGEYLVLVDLR